MRILQLTPAPKTSRSGNRTTADRWQSMLEGLGHDVRTETTYEGARDFDMLLALHAYRNAEAVRAFSQQAPDRPIVVALTGTDLYRDIDEPEAQRSVRLADALVCLHDLAFCRVPESERSKLRVIYQSVEPIPAVPPRDDVFEVAVAAHLRDVKDPLRTAAAARLLPESSNILISHVGNAMTDDWERAARREELENPRFDWLGGVPRPRALSLMSRARLLVLTSRMEGGANVVGEAITAGTPVLSSRIDGSLGLLGEDYPGYFPVGDTQALAELLERVEREPALLAELESRCEELRSRFSVDREVRNWRELLDGLPR